MERFPATMELALCAMILAVFLGIGAGIISAIKRYSIFDYGSMFIALAGVLCPFLARLGAYLFLLCLFRYFARIGAFRL